MTASPLLGFQGLQSTNPAGAGFVLESTKRMSLDIRASTDYGAIAQVPLPELQVVLRSRVALPRVSGIKVTTVSDWYIVGVTGVFAGTALQASFT